MASIGSSINQSRIRLVYVIEQDLARPHITYLLSPDLIFLKVKSQWLTQIITVRLLFRFCLFYGCLGFSQCRKRGFFRNEGILERVAFDIVEAHIGFYHPIWIW